MAASSSATVQALIHFGLGRHNQRLRATLAVLAVFEILEEIEAEIEFVNRVGARAFEGRDYEKAKEALQRAAEVTPFRDKAAALRCEWEKLFAREDDDESSEAHAARRNLGRLRRGLRTREEAYRKPILETLQALGGSAPMPQVLEGVLQNMNGVLRDVDYPLEA